MSQKNTSIIEAVNILRDGGSLFLESSETYVVCDATQSNAIITLFKLIENKQEWEPLLFICNLTMLEAYIPDIPEAAYQIMEVSDSPTIIEFESNRNIAREAQTPSGSIKTILLIEGTIHQLINRFRKPIVAFKTGTLRLHENNLIIETNDIHIDSSKRIFFHADHSFKILRN